MKGSMSPSEYKTVQSEGSKRKKTSKNDPLLKQIKEQTPRTRKAT